MNTQRHNEHQKENNAMKTTFSIKDLIPILSLIISISLPLGYAYMMKMNELVIFILYIVFGYKVILSNL